MSKNLVPIKAVKVTIAIPEDAFPWKIVPAPGTPGSKSQMIDLTLSYDEGSTISATIKAPNLQRVLAAKQLASGGYLVFQGRLADGGRSMMDIGVVYQPPRPSAE